MALRFDPNMMYAIRLRDLTDNNAQSKDLVLKGQTIEPLAKSGKYMITLLPNVPEKQERKYEPIDRQAGTKFAAELEARKAAHMGTPSAT